MPSPIPSSPAVLSSEEVNTKQLITYQLKKQEYIPKNITKLDV